MTGGEVFTAPISRDSLQGDCRFLDVLEKMGCRIRWEAEGVRVEGPRRLDPIDTDMNEMPDMVPTLAVLAAFAPGPAVYAMSLTCASRSRIGCGQLQAG